MEKNVLIMNKRFSKRTYFLMWQRKMENSINILPKKLLLGKKKLKKNLIIIPTLNNIIIRY